MADSNRINEDSRRKLLICEINTLIVSKLFHFPIKSFEIDEFYVLVETTDKAKKCMIYTNHGEKFEYQSFLVSNTNFTLHKLEKLKKLLETVLDYSYNNYKNSQKSPKIDNTPAIDVIDKYRNGNNQVNLGVNLHNGNNDTNLGVNVSVNFNFCQFVGGSGSE